MDKTTRLQLDLMERIAKHYKANGGRLYVYKGGKRVRISLADFILIEVPALRKYLARSSVKQPLTVPTRKKSLQAR